MEYSQEILSKVVDLGKLQYPAEKIISILNIPEKEKNIFIDDFNNPSHEIYKSYQMGIDIRDFEIDSKLYQLAKTGDLKAMKQLNEKILTYKTTIKPKSKPFGGN